jgi:hypothetical protein
LTEEKEKTLPAVSATEELPEMPELLKEEPPAPIAQPENIPVENAASTIPAVDAAPAADSVPAVDTAPAAESHPAPRPEGENRPPEHQRDDRRQDSRGGGRRDRDRPLTNEDKLRLYKKQSEERLLDIKRSKEAKIGKKRK